MNIKSEITELELEMVKKLAIKAQLIADFFGKFEISSFQVMGSKSDKMATFYVKRLDSKWCLSFHECSLKRNLTDSRIQTTEARGLWNYQDQWYEFCTITDFRNFGTWIKSIEAKMVEISEKHETTIKQILEDLDTLTF